MNIFDQVQVHEDNFSQANDKSELPNKSFGMSAVGY